MWLVIWCHHGSYKLLRVKKLTKYIRIAYNIGEGDKVTLTVLETNHWPTDESVLIIGPMLPQFLVDILSPDIYGTSCEICNM